VGKAAVEALSGRMALAFLHFGLMGDPVAVSPAGGVLGGLFVMLTTAGRRSTCELNAAPMSSRPVEVCLP